MKAYMAGYPYDENMLIWLKHSGYIDAFLAVPNSSIKAKDITRTYDIQQL
jgi:hypothetical protein